MCYCVYSRIGRLYFQICVTGALLPPEHETMTFYNVAQFQRSGYISQDIGAVRFHHKLRSSQFFRSMSAVMNLKRGGGLVSYLQCERWATKKLGEISIPGNSTTTPGSQKSLAFPTFFGNSRKRNAFLCVGCRLCLSSGGILSCYFFLRWFVCFCATRMSWLPALWLS